MSYAQLMEAMGQVNDLLNTQSILNWDARTMMPEGGHETRGKQLATLSVLTRDLLVSTETRRRLDAAEAEVASFPDGSVEKVMVAQVREAKLDRVATRGPGQFVDKTLGKKGVKGVADATPVADGNWDV